MEGLKIDTLTSDMAEEILNIHFSAVHYGDTSSYYSETILGEWSPGVTQERIDEFKNRLQGDGAQGIVARIGGKAVGFGIFVPSKSMVGAVYVRASYTGMGIGGLILKRIEEMALSARCHKLFLDASLNARRFYMDHGYKVIEKASHELPSGVIMECAKMEKSLAKRDN